MKIHICLPTLVAALTVQPALALDPLSIEWDKPVQVTSGGYPRTHRLNDGRLLCAYYSGVHGYVRMSCDGGATWNGLNGAVQAMPADTQTRVGSSVVTQVVATLDFVQYPVDHPKYANRIVFLGNYRSSSQSPYADEAPHTIAATYSDNAGVTWSAPVILFRSTGAGKGKGCYEPQGVIDADGNLSCYFADESQSSESGNQRIAKSVSTDGGTTWSAAATVCETPDMGRDGMPVMLRTTFGDYLAIESTRDTRWNHPMVWKDGVYQQPLAVPTSRGVACGAPYLCETENYLVLVYQEMDHSGNIRASVPHVNAVPKSEIPSSGSLEGLMRGDSAPALFREGAPGMNHYGARWAALEPLGGDRVLLTIMWCYKDDNDVTRERVYLCTGRISGGGAYRRNALDVASFEQSATGAAALDGWTFADAGVRWDTTATAPCTAGWPLSRKTHRKSVRVQGSAVRSLAPDVGERNYDFTLTVHVPSAANAPQPPAGNETLELAVGTDGRLYAACFGETTWSAVSDTVYAEGARVRVSAHVMPAARRVHLYLNGELVRRCRSLAGFSATPGLAADGETGLDDVILSKGSPQFDGFEAAPMSSFLLILR